MIVLVWVLGAGLVVAFVVLVRVAIKELLLYRGI
jgi:hypothetical protein